MPRGLLSYIPEDSATRALLILTERNGGKILRVT